MSDNVREDIVTFLDINANYCIIILLVSFYYIYNMENIYKARIESLRELMLLKGWDAVIISGSDPHSSEYPASRWKQVQWLSGFTGEAGDLVITADHAGLWTDTRYFIQAIQQLENTGIELHKTRVPEQILIPEWLCLAFHEDNCLTIAVDGLCQNVSAIQNLRNNLESDGRMDVRKSDDSVEKTYLLVDVPDLLNRFWQDRPDIPQNPITLVKEEIAGESRLDKITWIRSFISSKHCEGILLSALDEIAWILNVRGSDIEYNPLALSYLFISQDEVKWYVIKDTGTILDSCTAESFGELEEDGIQILPYESIDSLMNEFSFLEEKVYIAPDSFNFHLFNNIVDPDNSCIFDNSPVTLRKAIKNSAEISGMKKAQFFDGIAMEKFLFWLEKNMDSGSGITEWDASVKLHSLRSEIKGYVEDSFETISAYGKGGALPHYITPQHDAPILEGHGLYLCDSGGQYEFGTTDITRTVPLGPCTALEKEDYTLVLKGHIDLAMAIFPKGTAGCQIDLLARNPLWKAKRNFGHGTGHGVGFYLGVHEGPQEIRQNFNRQAILPGMITSDEPGIYREGLHGVRHENLILCKEAGKNSFGEWLEFETITLCHFDTDAIVKELLTAEEINWLNEYNKRVYDTLSPHLPEAVAEWLKEKTEAI